MSVNEPLIRALREQIESNEPPDPSDVLAARLEPLTIGMRLQTPILTRDARLFRVRRMATKPEMWSEVGPPPPRVASLGRLNDNGQSVLYMADSPDTAFAEARATIGKYCLSEWRIQPPKVVLANGGIPLDLLRAHFPNNFGLPERVPDGVNDLQVLELFQTLFTLSVEGTELLYRWSIAGGLANGFAAVCERISTEERDGNTFWTGRYPFSGIAYASMRRDKQAINFAFNDLGKTFLRLDNVQWVERHADGYFSGVDFASACDQQCNIDWQGRPAKYQLAPGNQARIVKVAAEVWNYEQLDGGIPYFC